MLLEVECAFFVGIAKIQMIKLADPETLGLALHLNNQLLTISEQPFLTLKRPP